MKEHALTLAGIATLINGVVLPLLVFYLKKISASASKVDLLDARFDASIKTLDKLADRADILLKDSVISKEQLNYLRTQVNELRQRSHDLGNHMAGVDGRLMKLEATHDKDV